MDDNMTNKTSMAFIGAVLIYLLLLIGFSIQIYQQELNPYMSKKPFVESQEIKKSDIVDVIVDQLKENKKGYSNNVWTTLGTVIAVISMVLGSTRFQMILTSHKASIPVIQAVLILLFVLHAYAYMLYQNGNIQLMQKLEYVAGSLEYYKSYSIYDIEVVLNLVFDSILFVFLAYTISCIKEVGIDKA